MLNIVAWTALILAVLNWAVFLLITFLNDIPFLQAWLKQAAERVVTRPSSTAGLLSSEQHAAPGAVIDPKKVLDAAGTLAGAFKKAGAGPTAAAMSLVCLVISALCAGMQTLHN